MPPNSEVMIRLVFPSFTSRLPLSVVVTLLGLLVAGQGATAQSAGWIAGTAVDANSGKALPGVNLAVQDSQHGAATDADGHFVIGPLPAGDHVLEARFVGFQSETQTVQVPAGDTTVVRFDLQPEAVEMAGVQVSALRPDLQQKAQLEKAQVQEANPRDSGELMRDLPGVNAARRGPVGLDPAVRGLRETEVGTYLDGTRIFPGGAARMDSPLSHLDPSAIQSIEVVKGPYALTWGAGNLSAVRVETRKPWNASRGPLNGRLQSGYDSNLGAFESAVDLFGQQGNVSYQLQGAWREGNDYVTGTDEEVPADFLSREMRGKLSYRSGPGSRFVLSAGYQDQDDIDYPGRLLNADYFRTYNLSARYLLEQSEGLVRSAEILAYVNDVDHGMTNDGKPTAQPDSTRMPPFPLDVHLRSGVNVTGGRINVGLDPEDPWTIEVGGDVYSARSDATRLIRRRDTDDLLFVDLVWPDVRVTDAGLFARLERSLGSIFRASGTLRLDQVWAGADTASAFFRENVSAELGAAETNLSGAVTISALPNEHWTLTAGLGSTARPADATERYSDRLPASKAQTSAEFMGTPTLASERSTQADLWIEASYPRATFSVNVFARRIDNYVTLAPTDLPKRLPLSPNTVYRYINGTATFWGFEASGAYALTPALTAEVRPTYLWGRDEALEEPVIGITPPNVDLGLRYEPEGGDLFLEATVRAVSEQDRVAVTRGETATDGYVTGTLKGGVDFGRGLSLQMGASNLLDANYVNHLNAKNPYTGAQIPEPGRVLFTDVTYQF